MIRIALPVLALFAAASAARGQRTMRRSSPVFVMFLSIPCTRALLILNTPCAAELDAVRASGRDAACD